ncbi:MAG: GGDEF domain-containing protein [Jatrophihabitans sp.]|nr:MAG: GGDEF domain-containing protein [Jatrophihabitans sp.]
MVHLLKAPNQADLLVRPPVSVVWCLRSCVPLGGGGRQVIQLARERVTTLKIAGQRKGSGTPSEGDLMIMEPPRLDGRQVHGARVRRWSLWALPPQILILVLVTDACAVALPVTTIRSADALTWIRLAAIALVAVGYAEAFDRVERLRCFLGEGRAHNNHQSIWAVAAILVVPAGAASLLVAITYGHAMLVARRSGAMRPHRALFTAATAICGTWAGAMLFDTVTAGSHSPLGGPLAVIAAAAAIGTMFVVNTGLVATAMRFTSTRRGRELLPPNDALWFEAATMVLGVVAAQLLITAWWLAPAVLGGLVALHRAALVTKLQVASATDLKTGLLNAATWSERARAAVRDAAASHRRVALIAVDLDHFKRVNDEHGHLVGDTVLRAVAGALRRESRAHDLVGRFGGEEFFVLAAGPTAAAHAVDLATRLREAIAALELPNGIRVTASLGIAHEVPLHGELDPLIAAADQALYTAKALGRDRVQTARPVDQPPAGAGREVPAVLAVGPSAF